MHPPQIELPRAIKLLQVGFGEERERGEGTNYSLVAHRNSLPPLGNKDNERGERSPRNRKVGPCRDDLNRVSVIKNTFMRDSSTKERNLLSNL